MTTITPVSLGHPDKNKPTAVLTPAQVLEIDLLLQETDLAQKLAQDKIAERYGVSKKTISRIATGQTWSDVTHRNQPKETPVRNAVVPCLEILKLPEKFIDFLDDLNAIKNHFGFSFDHPLNWGWFDWAEGKHSICTDGFIMWESADLVNFAQKMAQSEVNSYPVFASKARELGTFEIEGIMTKPIGKRYVVDLDCGGVVRLVNEQNEVIYLRQKYVAMAVKMKLEIRASGADNRFVYFTKSRNRMTADTSSVVIACVSTMQRTPQKGK